MPSMADGWYPTYVDKYNNLYNSYFANSGKLEISVDEVWKDREREQAVVNAQRYKSYELTRKLLGV